MSARNMVRHLRDSGALETRPAESRIRPMLATVLVGLVFGIVAYFGATSGLPVVMDLMKKDPPPVHFAKP